MRAVVRDIIMLGGITFWMFVIWWIITSWRKRGRDQ